MFDSDPEPPNESKRENAEESDSDDDEEDDGDDENAVPTKRKLFELLGTYPEDRFIQWYIGRLKLKSGAIGTPMRRYGKSKDPFHIAKVRVLRIRRNAMAAAERYLEERKAKALQEAAAGNGAASGADAKPSNEPGGSGTGAGGDGKPEAQQPGDGE